MASQCIEMMKLLTIDDVLVQSNAYASVMICDQNNVSLLSIRGSS